MAEYVHAGRGKVPAIPLVAAAWKQLLEIPGTQAAGASADGLGSQLAFTEGGLDVDQFEAFFAEALDRAHKVEPIVEAGNKYSVSPRFAELNGQLLLTEIKTGPAYRALKEADRRRADAFFERVCLNGELRNRNPLHPNPLDSAVIGNLLNWPKHLLGFPHGAYATDGNEALSLLFFSYRVEHQRRGTRLPARVLYVADEGDEGSVEEIEACAARLRMPFQRTTPEALLTSAALRKSSTHASMLGPLGRKSGLALVMCGWGCTALGDVAQWAARAGVALHIHLRDAELRGILATNGAPVHFELPAAVRSMSVEHGLLRCGYMLYRDPGLRDFHFDVPWEWQSQYLSPNEGGSGNSTPLYLDLCTVLLGWNALRDIARGGDAGAGAAAAAAAGLQPTAMGPYDAEVDGRLPAEVQGFEAIVSWATDAIATQTPVAELERVVFQFQRAFVGGKQRSVEALTSGGGTRSINLAFEAVFERTARTLGDGVVPRLLTGNPHLAVERAQRRFLFDVVRVEENGIISVDGLQREISDPAVVAVYAQTLSITDGITDPLADVLAVMEAENKRRDAAGLHLVTLINDCCLAFSVLLHNDGRGGRDNLRLLDLTEGCLTPTIVTQDAHKHLGADKGISMAMGTPGTLSRLRGHVKVGAQPSRGELVRAMADMLLVGEAGYYHKYQELAAAVQQATDTITGAGMRLIHAHNRVRGSTVFGVEDPSACVAKRVKAKGHAPSPLFQICPTDPTRCQTGWLLSLTPHCLREVRPGVKALDVFVNDLLEAHKEAAAQRSSLADFFREDSLAAILLARGDEESWGFSLLRSPGVRRDTFTLVLRRAYSAIFDCGVVCSDRRPAALQTLVKGSAASSLLLLLASQGGRLAGRARL